jgi:hypothetical protein
LYFICYFSGLWRCCDTILYDSWVVYCFLVTLAVCQLPLSLWLLIFVTSFHQQNQGAENRLQTRLTDVIMGFSLLPSNFLFQ